MALVWGMAAGLLMAASGVDESVQRWLWENYHQGFNNGMRVLGELGKGTVSAAVSLAVGGGLWLAGRKAVGVKVLMAVPVFALAGILNWVMKWSIGRPRPKEWLMNGGDAWAWQPFADKAVWWSFPSGHSCSVFAVAVWLALAFPRWRWVALGVAVVLSVSRFLAVTPHYAGDVVAGAAVGSAVAGWMWMGWRARRG